MANASLRQVPASTGSDLGLSDFFVMQYSAWNWQQLDALFFAVR